MRLLSALALATILAVYGAIVSTAMSDQSGAAPRGLVTTPIPGDCTTLNCGGGPSAGSCGSAVQALFTTCLGATPAGSTLTDP
jgi:hypothetical protein